MSDGVETTLVSDGVESILICGVESTLMSHGVESTLMSHGVKSTLISVESKVFLPCEIENLSFLSSSMISRLSEMFTFL